uniref:Membrane-associated 30 kDa protein, chloroplastic n=1 Tax=Triticum urartu TaxID=4572 RepID=A0A8R7PAL4_TRIUA
MLLSVRRLPAAPSRPAAHPHISPAPPTLRLRRQHGQVAVAMTRTASTAPVINSHIFSAPLTAKFRLRRQSNVKRYKCNVIRSNLFDRLTRVARSYANAVISSFEDPEKILDQAVLEMNDDLIKMRQATAQVLASQKRLENKYTAAKQADADWYRRAQLALQKGDEELAREALKRRKSYAVGIM